MLSKVYQGLLNVYMSIQCNNNKLLMSNTKYHSIGLKVKEKQESNLGRQSDDRKMMMVMMMGENSRGEANLKWVLSFERNVETDNRF